MLISDSTSHSRPFWIAILLVVAIAVTFWTTSRYPRLDEKAQMVGIVPLEGPITFTSIYAVDPESPLLVRVLQTAANWANENKKGMTFGLLFAAALLTVAAFVRRRRDPGAAGATLLGVVIGTPLGVCVNCAAPIARGLHASGVRLETTLAAMVSSPTLNVVVLTMVFTLFPLYVVLIKLAATFMFLLLVVPIVARLSKSDLQPSGASPAIESAAAPPLLGSEDSPAFTDWPGAAWEVLRTFARNCWWIVRTALPLMILAGFIGAFVIEVVPWEFVVSFGSGISRTLTLAVMSVLAVFALILPVPIAFDVVIASALMQAGMPIRYVMPMLFTLGSFSVYSFMILWRGVSHRAALWCALTLTALGVLSGVAAHLAQKWERSRLQELVYTELDRIETPPSYVTARPPNGHALGEIEAMRTRPPVTYTSMGNPDVAGIEVDMTVDRPRADSGRGGFVMRDSGQSGLVLPPLFDGEDFLEPFVFSAGLAAGDVHRDGFVDVLVPVRGALVLFANRGDARFVQQSIDAPALDGQHLMNAALVDIDNDGWLDIVAAGWGGGLWWLKNDRGRFDGEAMRPIDNRGANFTASFGFADFDRDGDLDVVLGNWHASLDIPPESARNWLLRNEGDGFRYEPLSDMTGETLATLFSDIDDDGWLDLLVGNDHATSDLVYLGDGGGNLADRSRAGDVFPVTARNTMSFDSADLDNDGRLEILIADISLGDGTQRHGVESLVAADACAQIREPDHRSHCRSMAQIPMLLMNMDKAGSGGGENYRSKVEGCLRTRDDKDRLVCIGGNLLIEITHVEGDQKRCSEFPATLPRFRDVCERSFPMPMEVARLADANAIPQSHFFNVLLERDEKDMWVDSAKTRGLSVSFWTWNAKFADLDLDGWQDLYAVTGIMRTPAWEPNIFLRNDGTGHFQLATKEAGLVDHLPTSSYVVADFDGDGDPDIVTRPLLGPLRLFENRAPAANAQAATFELLDYRGNRYGVGTKLTAYLPDGTRQIREIKASGGFQSFDPLEARFGLGSQNTIAHLDIRWSTGETARLDGPFPAGRRYRISRTP